MLPCFLRSIKRRNCISSLALATVTSILLFVLFKIELHLLKHRKAPFQVEKIELKKMSNHTRKIDVKDSEYHKMLERKKLKEEVCKKMGLDTAGNDSVHQVNPWEYLINEKFNLVWCNVFKSASTSWMYIFNVLAGYDPKFLQKTKAVPLQLAREKYSRPTKEHLQFMLENKDVTSFIVGRNPLERLVSAYREKIYGALPKTLHDKLRRRITQDFRGVSVPKTRKLPEAYIPTFVEFVKVIVRESKKGKEPEMHWAPAYSFCNPCQVCIIYNKKKFPSRFTLKKFRSI